MAGLPAPVLERARGLLAALERGELLEEDRRAHVSPQADEPRQLGLFGTRASAVEARLRELDVARMTPLDALNELHALVETVQGRGRGDEAHEHDS